MEEPELTIAVFGFKAYGQVLCSELMGNQTVRMDQMFGIKGGDLSVC
jgi:hypothetical protein